MSQYTIYSKEDKVLMCAVVNKIIYKGWNREWKTTLAASSLYPEWPNQKSFSEAFQWRILIKKASYEVDFQNDLFQKMFSVFLK